MKFKYPGIRETIRSAARPDHAAKLARRRRRQLRRDWEDVKVVYMTRGMYIKCRTHAEVAEALLPPAGAPPSRPANTTTTGVAGATPGD